MKIFVDSQAAISAIDNPFVKSQIVSDAVDALNKLADTTKSVTIVWIPAHKGHEGNERADILAKQGSSETDESRLLKVKRPQATLKSTIHVNVRRQWQEEWQALNMARHTKSFYHGPNQTKAKFVYKLARLELGRFVRIITGHNNLNFFQAKLGLARNPTCRFCGGGDETITHFIFVCPKLLSFQREMFLDTPPTADMKWSVRELLNFSYQPGINEAFEGTRTEGDLDLNEDNILNESYNLHWLNLSADD